MAITSIGDMAQVFTLRRMTTSLKQDASTAAQELTTGYSANISAKLGGDLTRLAGLEASLSRLKGYRSVTDSAAMTADAMQSVLRKIDGLTEGMGTSLLDAVAMENTRVLEGLVNDGADRFVSVVTALNAKLAGKTLFAGVASDGPAIADPDTILTAIEAAVAGAGAVSAEDIELAVTAWFDDTAGFATIGYLGGAASGAVPVSTEDKVDLGFTAADPAIRDTLKSLALVALVSRGSVTSDMEVSAQISRNAGAAVIQSQSDRTFHAGRLGVSQERIEQARSRNEAEGSALQLARSDLLAIDPYDAATRMEAVQSQLETLYSVTARLSRLRLVDFLR